MFKLFRKSLPFLLKRSPFLHPLPFPIHFQFSKVGKKKQEKIEKEKSKSQANLSSEIDLTQIEQKMQKEVDLYKENLSKLKAGRLTAEVFSKFSINAYGQKTGILDLVQVIPKTANSITLNVFDEKLVPDIMKVLENSDLNFQLKKDNKNITCISSGSNTKEIKESLVKEAKELLEEYKLKIRKHRSNGIETVIKPFKKFASADVVADAEKEAQNIFKKFEHKLEETLKEKEKELLK